MARKPIDLSGYNIAPDMLPTTPGERNWGIYSFFALWKNALGSAPALPEGEAVKALEELGTVLGRYELETQLRAVEGCRAVLCRRLDALRQSLPQTKRLTLGLSLAAAALVGIILI